MTFQRFCYHLFVSKASNLRDQNVFFQFIIIHYVQKSNYQYINAVVSTENVESFNLIFV